LILRRLQGSEFGRNVFKLGFGTAVGQGLVVLASPIWSRLYTPADFAMLGLFLSFISTASVVLALRYDFAIPLGNTGDEAPRLLALSLILTAPIAVLAGGGMIVLISTNTLGFGALPLVAVPVAVLVLLETGVFMALRYWHVGVGDFGPISRSLVLQGAGRASLPILLAWLKLGWLGLIAGEVLGRAFGIRRLAVPVLPLLRELRRRLTWRELRETAARYRRFPVVFLPSAMLDAIAAAAALPVFAFVHGLAAGGQFMLSQQVVNAPAALICAALADVYHQKLVSTARASQQAVVPLLWRSAGRVLAIASLALIPFCVLAPVAAVWIFGPQWRDAGLMIAILAPSTAISIASSALSRAFVLSRIPQVKLVADVLKLVLPVAGILVGSTFGSTPLASVIAYSIMYGVSYAIYFGVIVFAVRPSKQVSAI
jgi:O-antigen/teichoic acid export membrane protein